MKSSDRGKLSKLLLCSMFVVLTGWSGSSMSESLEVTVRGLVGTGLKLNVDGVERSVTNGSFAVNPNAVISIAAQPRMPAQACTVIKTSNTHQALVSCSQFLYALSSRAFVINYKIIPDDNHLEAFNHSYFGVSEFLDGYSSSLVTDPTGRFAYVQYCKNRRCFIASFQVNFTSENWGKLSASGPPVEIKALSSPLTMDPKGRFMYRLSEDGTLTGYAINQNDGTLKEIAIKDKRKFVSMAIDSKGEYAYLIGPNQFNSTAGEGVFDVILAYKIDPKSGELSNVFNRPDALYDGEQLTDCVRGRCMVVADPLGRFVYVKNDDENLKVFRAKENGKFENVTPNSIRSDGPPNPNEQANYTALVADPTGKFIFMAKSSTGEIVSYRITEQDKKEGKGEVKIEEAGRIKVSFSHSHSIGVDFTGKLLFVPHLDRDKSAIYIYAIDDAGALSIKGDIKDTAFAHSLAITR